jgi:hypothetical protein
MAEALLRFHKRGLWKVGWGSLKIYISQQQRCLKCMGQTNLVLVYGSLEEMWVVTVGDTEVPIGFL